MRFSALLLLLWIEQLNAAGVLVLAPHPDDDVLIASGVISNAISQGQPVKVVYVTNGDISGTGQGFLREGEAVTAQTTYLGTAENDLIFLGYPDSHLQEIYSDFINSSDRYTTPFGQSVTYGNRGLGLSDYHTFRFGSAALYNRFNIVLDLQDIISTYRPDHIYTVSEYDTHTDHFTTYSLLKLALSAVLSVDPNYKPVVHKTMVHFNSRWPAPPDPIAYNDQHDSDFAGVGLQWNARESLDVPLPMQSTNIALNPKYQAIDTHASQGGGSDPLLGRFLHKDEVFWPVNLNGGNRLPRAAAGFDFVVVQGAVAQLNGTGSFDLD
jgi:LmbE family N-acetylglucosaminyl deacetylase